ncbi:MAG: SDR family oxidoreductase [Streptosporangiales bacterium]|nr:SDR family oxidoreductase [Streptosporangiales bacterium]
MELDIDGRAGLVTGATSGIGRATAVALAAEGVRLAVQGRRKEQLDELAGEIEASGGRRPAVVVCELLDADAAEVVARAATEALGSVDILVNNAGGSRPLGVDATDEAWDEATTLNFTRHRQLATRLLPAMRSAGWGRIINITGKSEPPTVNGAVVAKAAVMSWSKGLSRDVGHDGVTVNCVAPGKIMSDQILRNYSPEFRERQAADDIPVGRYGQPVDVANLVCYLASERAAYLTGIVVPVDGGMRRHSF